MLPSIQNLKRKEETSLFASCAQIKTYTIDIVILCREQLCVRLYIHFWPRLLHSMKMKEEL